MHCTCEKKYLALYTSQILYTNLFCWISFSCACLWNGIFRWIADWHYLDSFNLFAAHGWELCLSPVGLSSVTKLSPQRIVGFMMGMWFFASAAGNFVAGEIAKATATDVSGASADVYDLVQKQSFIDVYTNVGLMAVGVAFVLLLLSPLLNSRSHGIK